MLILGILQVAEVEAKVNRQKADAAFYTKQREADGQFYNTLKAAEGATQASALQSEQEAKNIILLAQAEQKRIEMVALAYDSVKSDHAKKMQMCKFEVDKRQALPKTAIVFEGANQSDELVSGFKLAQALKLAGATNFRES